MSVLLTSFVVSFICSGSVAAAGAVVLSRRNRTKDDDFGVVSIKHKKKEIARLEREKNECYKQEIEERIQLAIDHNINKISADQREKIEKELITLKRSHLYPEWKSEEPSLRRDPSNKKNIRKKKTEKKTERTSVADMRKEVRKIIEERAPRSRAERLAREFKDFQKGTQRSVNKYDEFYDRLDEYGFYDWHRP